MAVAPPPPAFAYTTYWSNDGTSESGSEPTAVVNLGVTNGLFTVVLGDTTLSNMAAIPASLFTQPNLQLRLWFNDGAQGFAALDPAQSLTPAPYAVYANTASNLNNGLVIQQNTNGAPNVIDGSSENFVSTGVVGATVAGGGAANYMGGLYKNSVTADFGTVSGGFDNAASGGSATVSGGSENTAGGVNATVSGGDGNTAGGEDATVSGGSQNIASDVSATVGGGENNTAGGEDATVSGGNGNTASGEVAAVGGGSRNTASGSGAMVGGGSFNTASGPGAFVGGGGYDGMSVLGNNASGAASVVAGGLGNQATSTYATVPGGANNKAGGEYSFAAGQQAQALHPGAFVWADSQNATLASTANDQFIARASGGFFFYTKTGNVGAQLDANATSWTTLSDRNAKKNFRPVNTVAVLDKLAAVPIEQWNYKWEKDSDVPNLGPMAQDFIAAFYPGRNDKGITTLEFDGVELAAIQGLNQKLEDRSQELEQENAKLKAQNDSLARQLNELAREVKAIEQKR